MSGGCGGGCNRSRPGTPTSNLRNVSMGSPRNQFLPSASSTLAPYSTAIDQFAPSTTSTPLQNLRHLRKTEILQIPAYDSTEGEDEATEEDENTDPESDYASMSSFPDPHPMPWVKAESMMQQEICRNGPCAAPGPASFGGQGLFDRSGMGKSQFEPWIEKNTSWRREPANQTSILGPHLDMWESDYDFSDPVRRQRGFDPYVHMHELRKFASPYKNFDPSTTSTPTKGPPPERRARGAWKSPPPSRREPSFERAATPPEPYGTRRVREGLNPCTAADDSATAGGIKHLLEEMEWSEMSTIKKDLKDFQKARRKLIFDATKIRPMFRKK